MDQNVLERHEKCEYNINYSHCEGSDAKERTRRYARQRIWCEDYLEGLVAKLTPEQVDDVTRLVQADNIEVLEKRTRTRFTNLSEFVKQLPRLK